MAKFYIIFMKLFNQNLSYCQICLRKFNGLFERAVSEILLGLILY